MILLHEKEINMGSVVFANKPIATDLHYYPMQSYNVSINTYFYSCVSYNYPPPQFISS